MTKVSFIILKNKFIVISYQNKKKSQVVNIIFKPWSIPANSNICTKRQKAKGMSDLFSQSNYIMKIQSEIKAAMNWSCVAGK